MSTVARIALVEDDAIMGESLLDRFRLEGYAVDWFQSAEEAMDAIRGGAYGAVISDVRLPGVSGDEMFRRLRAEGAPLPPFLFITGFGAIDRAVELLKLGAADYVTKPFDLDQLVEKVCALAGNAASEGLLGVSPAMRRIEETIPRIARHASAVLVTGESGVGKERVAQLIHRHAHAEAGRPFVAVNCGALPESLMDAELFGYEKGAFTGAARQKKGVFEQAHGGTLFLDEVGELPPPTQVKLLRAIQERIIVRVGGETPVAVDFRLVCATNRDLQGMVERGCFREDLYYRIHVIHLKVPPLRERKSDIPWFARRFIEEFGARQGGPRRSLHPAAEQALIDYPWPGNVRELRHAVERACIMWSDPMLTPAAFFEETRAAEDAAGAGGSLAEYLHACERAYIRRALDRQAGHIAHTAEELGISRKNLWEKMRKLGLADEGREREG